MNASWGCLLAMLGIAMSYDCYNSKCQGSGSYYSTYIYCDQEYRYCQTDDYGYPVCYYGDSGDGIFCSSDNYNCKTASTTGKAYCDYDYYNYDFPYYWVIGGPSLFVIIVVCLCCYCCRRRRNTVIIQQQQRAVVQPPTVVQNINVQPKAAPNPGPIYPPNAGYAPHPGPAYIPHPGPAYPPNQGPAYPPNQGPAYPPNQGPAYPPNQGPAYPPNQGPAYLPNRGPAYPPNQGPAPGYNDPQAGYSVKQGSAPPPYQATENTTLLKTPASNPQYS